MLNFLSKIRRKNKNTGFADFFLHASERKKKRVFTQAARQANEQQRQVIKKAEKLQKAT